MTIPAGDPTENGYKLLSRILLDREITCKAKTLDSINDNKSYIIISNDI